MKIVIRHRLSLPVGSDTARALQHVLLTPLSGPTQTVREWSLVMPGIESASRFTDAFGNRALLVGQTRPEEELAVSITGVVDTVDRNGVLGRIPGEPVVALFRRVTPQTAADPDLVAGFAGADRTGPGRIALLHAIMEAVGARLRWDGLPADGDTGAQQQSSEGQSQSQSSDAAAVIDIEDEREAADASRLAHLFIGTARALDIPARYVTGYLAADDDHPAAFHAWAEAYDDGLGWIGFDPALGLCPTDRHVRVATGLDALSTAPVRTVPQVGPAALVELSAEATAQ